MFKSDLGLDRKQKYIGDARYIRFHDLRHTSATIPIIQGVHAKIISERLGHVSITTTTNIFARALRTADQAAADKFESFFTF
uniref:tyrosine-type recombinase/integrase n=1 Tax=Paenibacillus athensensis TaxID=1967502 RepID=UPI0022A87ABD|nr:tyrosine-type recombinase/integrase [Paenibacillus athensensis]